MNILRSLGDALGALGLLTAGACAWANPPEYTLRTHCSRYAQYIPNVTVERVYISNPHQYVTLQDASRNRWTYRIVFSDYAIGGSSMATANLLKLVQTAFIYNSPVNVCVGVDDLVGIELSNE